MENLKKIPKLFRGSFTEEDFKRKILNKLYIHEYKNFIQEVFYKNEEGVYKVKENLETKDIKRLKKIAKSIKSNEGFILKGRLTLLGFFLGTVVLFNAFFKDRLIERGLERSLENIFEAKADIRDLNFNIFEGRINFKSLEVANCRKPFRNLFELGETEIHLDLQKLIRGKVIINNVKFQEIRWDTERKTSGALTRRKKKTSPAIEIPKSFGEFFLEDSKKVVMEIIEREKKNIKSPKLLEELVEKYKSLEDKWKENSAKQKKGIEGLPKIIEPIKTIKVEEIKTVEEAINSYNKVEDAYKEIKLLESKFSNTYKELKEALGIVNEDKKKIENTIKSDYSYLSSFIKSPEKRKEIVTSILRPIIERYTKEIHNRFKIWIYYFEKLKPMIKRREGKELVLRAYGRDVTFPTTILPKFWIKNIDVSLGSVAERNLYGIKVKHITSDQNLINSPTTFSIKRIKNIEEIELAGLIDKRDKREKIAAFNFNAKNIPFFLEEEIKAFRIRKIKGNYNLEGKLAFNPSNKAEGSLSLHLFSVDIDLKEEDKIGALLKYILSKNPVDIEVSYLVSELGNYDFKISSNLDELVSEVIEKLMVDWLEETKGKLNSELNNLLKEKFQEYEDSLKGFISIEEDLKGNLLELNTYVQFLEKKKQELQTKIEERKNEAKKMAKEKIEEKIKEKIKIPF
ncbi:MAG: TIGR03545 family protein [candidate division WOR-3 bacterium]